jgi:HK97 family phage portal protein
MVLPISSFILGNNSSKNIRVENRPMFTSMTNIPTVSPTTRYFSADYKLWWRRFKQTPELIATISVPIVDIIGDRPTWSDTNGKPLNDLQLKKAKKFWRDNRLKETITAMLFDAFLLGDGFLWKGKAKKEEVAKAIKEVLKKFNLCELETKELVKEMSQDEDIKKTKRVDYVAASTMTILHDEFEVLGYEQQVSTKVARFSPEDIIHYRYMTVNGEVKGFSPAESLILEIILLTQIKENMKAWMENGGYPDKAFILPKEMANSHNHQMLLSQLSKYKKIQNRHGNLVFTGEITIEDLQGNPKDMEFKELALYITSNLAFAWGIPVSRIPYLIGSAASSGDSTGLAESGYWNKISSIQDTIEDLLNSQLFDELGWNINFDRKYKQDILRDKQIEMMSADTLMKYQQILSKNNKKLSIDKILEELKWNDEDIEDMSPEEIMNNQNSGNDRQNLLSNKNINKEQDNRTKAQAKANTANNKGVGEALYNP